MVIFNVFNDILVCIRYEPEFKDAEQKINDRTVAQPKKSTGHLK